MSKIFISYRRDDSAPYAGRIFHRLAERFGADQVFMDIDHIEPGEDFAEAINRHVSQCGVVLVLIGPGWARSADRHGARRLDSPNDFVRLEIVQAIARGARVMPVLVGKAAMPGAQELPDALQPLAKRQAIEISDTRFHFDVGRLIEAIERVLGGGAVASAALPSAAVLGASAAPDTNAAPPARRRSIQWPLAAAAAAIVGIGLAWVLLPRLVGAPRTAHAPAPSQVASAATAAPLPTAVTSAAASTAPRPETPPSVPASAADTAAAKPGASPPPEPRATPPIPAVLRVQDTFVAGSTYSEAVKAIGAAVNAAPRGAHELRILPTTGVAALGEALAALQHGTLDAVALVPGALGAKDEGFSALEGPPYGPDLAGYGRWRRAPATQAAADVLYAAQGLKGITCAVAPGWDLWSRTPLVTAADLRGKKIRSAGLRARVYRAAGAIVVQLPNSEVAGAMRAGVIDAAEFQDTASAMQAGLAEVARYLYPTPLARAAGIDLAFRAELWAQLDTQTRQRIEAACAAGTQSSAKIQAAKIAGALTGLRSQRFQVAPVSADVARALLEAWPQATSATPSERNVAALLSTLDSQPGRRD
jgi:TRAP-type mannitol/chloroaromatic compound transport system substrate-binding protein